MNPIPATTVVPEVSYTTTNPSVPVQSVSYAVSALPTVSTIPAPTVQTFQTLQPIPPTPLVTSTDCKRESNEYWDCFEPSFMEGKGTVCRGECLRECSSWLGHSRGLLAECQEAMHEVLRIYPADVSPASSLGTQASETSGKILETGQLGRLPFSPNYLYAPQSFPSALKSAFLEVHKPYIYLAIETPGYYLLPDGQRRLRYYISHFISPVIYNDEIRWHIQPTLGQDGRPLAGITLQPEAQTLLDMNATALEICNIMGTSNVKSLIVNLEIPSSTLHTTFRGEAEMKRWWEIFRHQVRIFKGRSAWFPPAAGEFSDLSDEFLFFSGQNNGSRRPFRWSLKLSLRHLLLFYLIKTKPEGSTLTHLETRNVTYSHLPKKVRDYFQDWYYSHG
jgi:hypothetical protein